MSDDFLMDFGKEESSRREFMKTVGKMAIYTSPVVIALMHPSRDALACSGGGRPDKPWKDHKSKPNKWK